jgi:hypothetical protein
MVCTVVTRAEYGGGINDAQNGSAPHHDPDELVVNSNTVAAVHADCRNCSYRPGEWSRGQPHSVGLGRNDGEWRKSSNGFDDWFDISENNGNDRNRDGHCQGIRDHRAG